jgi:hypothetical protein
LQGFDGYQEIQKERLGLHREWDFHGNLSSSAWFPSRIGIERQDETHRLVAIEINYEHDWLRGH